MVTKRVREEYEPLPFSLRSFELSSLFSLVKEYERLKSHELQHFIERIYHHAVFGEGMALSQPQLESFELAYKLVRLNVRTQTILTMLFMHFLPEVRRED